MSPKPVLIGIHLIPLVFVSSNTDPLFTHEACVTQLPLLSVVTRLQVCQRLGVEAVEGAGPIPGASPRCPGQTLSARAAPLCGSSTGLGPTLATCRDPCIIIEEVRS